MLALWQIQPSNIRGLRLLGQSDRFTAFMNALLRASARRYSVTDNLIRTTVRMTVPDGGVDGAIDTVVNGDDTGWLTCPSAWQFKAQPYKGLTPKKLRNEINKPYTKELIKNGYGYRLAICDGMTPERKGAWNKLLLDEAVKIASNAQPPMVVTEDDLAQWANRFPGVCIAFFHRNQEFQVFEDWQAETRQLVPEYVTPDGLGPTLERLAGFADLSTQTGQPCLSVQGAAGVGKTRLVCEAMANLEGASSLVLYTDDEKQAVRLAKQVAANPQCSAIIIADECTVQARVDLANALNGHAARARAICIDNSAQRPPTAGEEVVVESASLGVVEQILQRNFPGVPQTRLRAYAGLAGGFIRLAVDLCQFNAWIGDDGALGAISNHFHDEYLQTRLNTAQLQAIKAISLLPKVGFKGDVAEELDCLGQICGLSRQTIFDAAKSMKDAPGFVAFAGRYLYVTPQIIAVAAFQRAWQTHIEHDPERFLRGLPPVFIERFHKQVDGHGTTEMKQTVSDFFGQWVSQMSQQDLADEGKVRRLIQLVELWPELHLPALKRLILNTPREELRAMHVATGFGRSPRRELVWFCERTIALPEYFRDVEEMLLHLALAESEAPNVANNATHIWRQIFRPVLSGTSVPFGDRIRILRTRLFSNDAETRRLALGALEGIFYSLRGLGMRTAGPAVIMGRIPPDEWQPRSTGEWAACWRLPVNLLVECSHSPNQELSHEAQRIAVENLRNLIPGGFFGELKTFLAPEKLSSDLLPQLLENVDFLLKHDVADRNMSPGLLGDIRAWLTCVVPRDTRARIVAAVGQQMISHYGEEIDAPWNAELTKLAQELLADSNLLRENLKWLCSDEARSATAFGIALGKLDKNAQLIKTIMNAIGEYHSTAFAVGYLSGLLSVSPSHAPTFNALLDSLVEQSPRDAFELITAGGDLVHGFERVTGLVRGGRLGIEYLRTFDFGVIGMDGRLRKLTDDETLAVLELFAGPRGLADERALGTGVHFLWSQTMPTSGREPGEIFGKPAMVQLARRIFSASAKHGDYYWREAIIKMLPFDSTFVINTCTRSMLEGTAVAAREAEAALAAALPEHAAAVLKALTPYVRGKKAGWKFRILKYGDIVRKLPGSAVAAWLDKVGVDGAKALARSLPAPFLDEQKKPVIPDVTLVVLQRFGDRKDVFHEFCIGLHSFQTYFGDIAAQHMREAEIAKAFLGHEDPVIQQWAQQEITDSKREAQRERQEQEELDL